MPGNPVSIQIDPTPKTCPPYFQKHFTRRGHASNKRSVSSSASKRIVLRCEKTAQNYDSLVALALGFILIKSVHTDYNMHALQRLLYNIKPFK